MMHYGPVRSMASSTFQRKIILFFFLDSILKSKQFLQKKNICKKNILKIFYNIFENNIISVEATKVLQ
jgi:hypothetical protein